MPAPIPRMHGLDHRHGGPDPVAITYEDIPGGGGAAGGRWLYLYSSGAAEATPMPAKPTSGPGWARIRYYHSRDPGGADWYTLCNGENFETGLPIPSVTPPWDRVTLDPGVYLIEPDLYLYEPSQARRFAMNIELFPASYAFPGRSGVILIERLVDATITTGYGNFAFYARFHTNQIVVMDASMNEADRTLDIAVFHNKTTAFTLGPNAYWYLTIWKLE